MSIYPWKTRWVTDQNVQSGGGGKREETGGRSEMSKKWQSGLSEQSPEDSKTTCFTPPHGLFIQEKITSSRSHCCLFAISILLEGEKKQVSERGSFSGDFQPCVQTKVVWMGLR